MRDLYSAIMPLGGYRAIDFFGIINQFYSGLGSIHSIAKLRSGKWQM